MQHPLHRMALILAKAHGAVDWFNGVNLGVTHGTSYQIHNHHIFPLSVLKKAGYDPQNHIHRIIINEIANRAFLTAGTNLSIYANLPEKYLPEVERRYPDALAKQFIPKDPSLWEIDNFTDFLEARRELIAHKINEFMKALIAEPEVVRERPIKDLIAIGEGISLEFKSTLQWDIVQRQVNKSLRFSVLKTIVAFLNSFGGMLVIGVEDDGKINGLDNDLKILQGSSDRFEQLLTSLTSEYIGPEYSGLIKIRLENVDDKSVCVIEADKAQEPAFLKGDCGKEFHIRLGNTTHLLDAEETVRYIQMNWE